MFCKFCGKELPENAYVCVGCGCLVGKAPEKKEKKEKKIREPNERQPIMSFLFKIFLIISFSATVLSLGASLFSLTYADVYSHIPTSYYNWSIRIYPNFAFSLFATILGAIGLGFAIVVFIFGLKEKETLKWVAIFNFIFSVALFICIFGCASYSF